MINVELYINNQLCDIRDPQNLGIRLNRVLINPAELAMKDAQYSYSITIPSSPVNDAIFKYINVEETKNKFNHNHTAQVHVDSVLVFDGRFKLSEIDQEGNYKGNLVVPIPKTVKEIFGDKKMNEISEWGLSTMDSDNTNVPMDIAALMSKYNKSKDIPDCIFPLVLYGLLPKVAKDADGNYTDKNLWDEYVRLGIEDLPPSLNCMETIKKIFEGQTLDDGTPMSVSGSAFNDERLTNLYMSYKNPTEYEQPWHWGYLGEMHVSGDWTNYRVEDGKQTFEQVVRQNELDRTFIVADFFNSSMVNIRTRDDKGTNILYNETDIDNIKKRRKKTNITIPVSGLYQIDFSAKIHINEDENKRWYGGPLQIHSGKSSKKDNNFDWRGYEVKVLRDFASGDFKLDSLGLDGNFYRSNMPQDLPWSAQEESDYYFPVPGETCVQFVDPIQNEQIVSGFRWGERNGMNDYNPIQRLENKPACRILAIKNGWSWDSKFSQKEKIYSAINSRGYRAWKVEEGDDDKDEEEAKDENGNDIDTPDVWHWEDTKKFKVAIDFIKSNSIQSSTAYNGRGELHQVVWLNKGEHLTVVTVCDEAEYKRSGQWSSTKRGWTRHEINFDLHIKPVSPTYDWIKVDNAGTGIATEVMNIEQIKGFDDTKIDLAKFLPSNIKIDDWLTNFCKAFNLELTQPTPGQFRLDIKQQNQIAASGSLIDLDSKVSLLTRTNQALGLPSEFQVGFTINKEEYGYIDSGENKDGSIPEDGGGSFSTGSLDVKVVSQTSTFSYNWYKDIVCSVGKDENGATIIEPKTLQFPVILNKEVWRDNKGNNYPEMVKKQYVDYAQRFWYRTDTMDNMGTIFNRNMAKDNVIRAKDLYLPRLSNIYKGQRGLTLDYHDKAGSILRTYFGVVATNDSNYTEVEYYLTPDEYEQLANGKLVSFNSDLYYVASIDGYDPVGKNKTKLKLIRKIS